MHKNLYGDIGSAIDHNGNHHESPVVEVILEILGENDAADWHWIVKLENGRYAYGWGGCDYTGWDCQSALYFKDSRKTVKQAIDDVPHQDNNNRDPHKLFKEMRKGMKKEKQGEGIQTH